MKNKLKAKTSKIGFFTLFDISAATFFATLGSVITYSYTRAPSSIAVGAIFLIIWMIFTFRLAMQRNHVDEFAAYCWNQSASAVMIGMIIYFVLFKFLLNLALNVYSTISDSTLLLKYLENFISDKYLIELLFLIFYLTFYFTRFRSK